MAARVPPVNLQPAPDGAAGLSHRSSDKQRRDRREMCALLRDDLYERSGSGECSAVWTSPLKWSVEYGCMADGERTWARVLGPDGKVYAATTDADADWLHGAMP